MKRFFQDTRGSALIWAAFALLILFTLSFVVYTGLMVYMKYSACETELERAAVIAVDMNMENSNIRDVYINIPKQPALTELENNLVAAGLVQSSSHAWKKLEDDELLYEIRSLNVTVHDEWVELSGLFSMPLPWTIGGQTEISIPIAVRSRVIFLD